MASASTSSASPLMTAASNGLRAKYCGMKRGPSPQTRMRVCRADLSASDGPSPEPPATPKPAPTRSGNRASPEDGERRCAEAHRSSPPVPHSPRREGSGHASRPRRRRTRPASNESWRQTAGRWAKQRRYAWEPPKSQKTDCPRHQVVGASSPPARWLGGTYASCRYRRNGKHFGIEMVKAPIVRLLRLVEPGRSCSTLMTSLTRCEFGQFIEGKEAADEKRSGSFLLAASQRDGREGSRTIRSFSLIQATRCLSSRSFKHRERIAANSC